MPTQDGIFYSIILENIKFIFAKKVYTDKASKEKESVDWLVSIKGLKDSGLIEYNGGYYGRVVKIGQKNFGIEDVGEQNIDITEQDIRFLLPLRRELVLRRFRFTVTDISVRDNLQKAVT